MLKPKPQPWEKNWLREPTRFRGGQSSSFLATATDGSGRKAFIKTLTRVREDKARRRFRREAAAYETLAGLGPPRLYEHNADTWQQLGEPMFMALEYIDGPDLLRYIRDMGCCDAQSALECMRELATVIHRCHENGVLHRDVKPSNIVLRGGNIATPVLVDFGLSFNDTDEDDLTRIGEEIGNRFLRVPEHAEGNRTKVSDVTQLAGVFIYLLTATEPRALLDSVGRKPHQRAVEYAELSRHFQGRQLVRLMSVFDKAFNISADARFQLASDLLSALESAMRNNPDDTDDDLASLLARVDEIALREEQVAMSRQRESLSQTMQLAHSAVSDFAHKRHLQISYSGVAPHISAPEGWMERKISAHMDGQEPNYVTYRVEARDPDEFVLLVDGTEVWRGSSNSRESRSTLLTTVTTVAAKRFLHNNEA